MVQEDLAAKRRSDNFKQCAEEEEDELLKKDFLDELAKIEENRLLTQANISNANAKVMRLVKDICAEHNEKLADKAPRKRKAPVSPPATSKQEPPKRKRGEKKKSMAETLDQSFGPKTVSESARDVSPPPESATQAQPEEQASASNKSVP